MRKQGIGKSYIGFQVSIGLPFTGMSKTEKNNVQNKGVRSTCSVQSI